MKSPVKPLYYARAVELIKKAKRQAATANRFWLEADAKNAPLWTENARLRELVASHERTIRQQYAENRRLQERLDTIAESISPTA